MTKTVTVKRAQLDQWLEALQKSFPADGSKYEAELEQKHREAITAIKEALIQQEGQSNYCLQCEDLSRELAALKAQQSNEQVDGSVVWSREQPGYDVFWNATHPPIPTAQEKGDE